MWDGVGVESKIESVGEVCETEWPNVLKVSDANAVYLCIQNRHSSQPTNMLCLLIKFNNKLLLIKACL